MSTRSFWTQILFSTLIALVLALPAQAHIRSATVAVDGMACPFCAFGVEKRLRKVEGVESIAVSTKEGTATLVAKDGASIVVQQIPGAVKAAGFTPGSITVEAVGKITTDEQDRLVLEVSGSGARFLIGTFDAALEEKVRAFAGTDTLVSVVGPIHEHEDDLPAISPEAVERVGR